MTTVDESTLSVSILVRGTTKALLTQDAELITKLRLWNLGTGVSVHFYYNSPEQWDVRQITHDQSMVDKPFRKDD
jgi:hypothetical protein